MSRTRNAREPFHATALGRMQPGTRGIVRELDAVISRSELGHLLWPGSGWRTGSKEHNEGTSIDWIIVENVGMRPTAEERDAAMQVINWLIDNRDALDLEGILFSTDGGNRTQVIGYSQPFERSWRNLTHRRSISADHIDHFHAKFRLRSTWPSALNGAVIGGSAVTPAPRPPKTGAPSKSIAQMATEIIAGRHGDGHTKRQNSLGVTASVYAQVRTEVNRRTGIRASTPQSAAPPFPAGIGPHKSRPSAVTLQRQLKRAGFMPQSVKENDNYGPETRNGVARFHDKHPQFKSQPGYRPQIGPKGWAYLFTAY